MRSIALKLWLGMMALVLVVLVLLILFQIVFLDKFYTDIKISDIKKQSLEIAKMLEEGNTKGFENNLDLLAYNNNLSAELLDEQRNIIYSTDTAGTTMGMPMMRNRIMSEEYGEVMSGNTVMVTMTHPRFGSKFLIIGLPVKTYESKTAALLINLPMISVTETVGILKRQLFYITIVLLVSSLILSYLLSRTFTKPIRDITKVSRQMADGDLSARINLESSDEIGRLAVTINRMGEGLSKIEQLRKDLIANVSHELRTPISLIRGYAETIRDVTGSIPEKREKQIGIIIEESDRLGKIVDDVLNLSQMQAGYLKLNKSRFFIDEILDRVYKKYEILSNKTGVSLHLIKPDRVMVEADENRIEQVLYNLINNAFNHSKEGDIITVAAVVEENSVRINVSDTGEGIPEDEIEFIWDRFYKVERSEERKVAGTGLGLAIVKSILTAHGFNYGVESKVGYGTTFWIEIKRVL